jgi:dihydrodipicolinate synthase/N-acetylneuraminate lyase
MFRGTFTALVTPFREGAVDYTTFSVIPSEAEESLTICG